MPTPEDDPFAAIEELAKRQSAEEKASKTVAAARAKLVLGKDARSAFFATLAMRLKINLDWSVPTMAIDGKNLFVNPEWNNGLTSDERVGVVCHEVLHAAMRHHTRMGGRDPKDWNAACDLAVNQILEKAGFTLPKTRLMPGEGSYKGFPPERSAEEYYKLIHKDKPEGEGDDGEGGGKSNDPGGCGEVIPPQDDAEKADQEAKWDRAVAQAERASQSRGKLPAGLARVVEEVLHPPADWRAILREFITKNARTETSWARPNRRFVSQGMYLPGRSGAKLGKVVIAIDRSGSIGKDVLDKFGSEVEAILASYDCTAVILDHDYIITKETTWEPDDGPLSLEAPGGGGTSHVEVFEHVARMDEPPVCVVALTDLYTQFPAEAPEAPTLWAVWGDNQTPPPFGQVVRIGD